MSSPLAAELLFSKLEEVDAADEELERRGRGDGAVRGAMMSEDGDGGGRQEEGAAAGLPPPRVAFYERFYAALGDERAALERVLDLKEAFAREALEEVVGGVLLGRPRPPSS